MRTLAGDISVQLNGVRTKSGGESQGFRCTLQRNRTQAANCHLFTTPLLCVVRYVCV